VELFEALMERRSVRSFKSEPVSTTLLDKILEAARWAPSAGDCQARDVIIIQNIRIKKKLSAATLDQIFIEEAPLTIVVCANELKSAERYRDRGKAFYCILDAAAAVQNILLVAHSLGLGACWIGAFNDRMVSEILRLPMWLRPVAIIPIGYPGETPTPFSQRFGAY
jgi:nitroreductase